MELKTKEGYYVGHPTLKVGSVVQCIVPVPFVDGTRHNKGDQMVVTEETLAYFSLFVGSSYEVVK